MKTFMKTIGLFGGIIFVIMGMITIPDNSVDSYTRKISIGLFLLGILLIYLSINPALKKHKHSNINLEKYVPDQNEPTGINEQLISISNREDNIQPQFKNTSDIIVTPEESQPEKEADQQVYARPSADYIKTIFLHLFEKHPYKEDDTFPGYFNYEYGIINMPTYFNEIKNEGLITLSPPEEILGLMKVSDLKEILSERALKKSGKKNELIERILVHIDANELPIINEYYFSLSPTGKEYIETHYDYVVLKQHAEWGIGFWEYQNEKDKNGSAKSFNEIILSLLNIKILDIKKTELKMSPFEYTRLLDLYIYVHRLFLDEGRYTDALKALFKNVLLSLSGCRNNYLLDYKKNLKLKNQEVMLNYFPIMIDSYVAKSICDLREYYIESILSDVYKEFIGPYNLCTYDMLCEVTTLIFNSSILELSKYDIIIRDLFLRKLK